MHPDKAPGISVLGVSLRNTILWSEVKCTYQFVVSVGFPVQELGFVKCVFGKFHAILIRILEVVLRFEKHDEDGNSC
jgi:hypothetical protein